jgi:general stress protein YciG
MDPEKQREIARKGGRAAHEKGSAHEFSPDEAREAGRKGGERVSMDRGRMAEIGRRGGLISAARRATRGGRQPGQEAREQNTSPDDQQRSDESQEEEMQ